jgi:hypothetical protein
VDAAGEVTTRLGVLSEDELESILSALAPEPASGGAAP